MKNLITRSFFKKTKSKIIWVNILKVYTVFFYIQSKDYQSILKLHAFNSYTTFSKKEKTLGKSLPASYSVKNFAKNIFYIIFN